MGKLVILSEQSLHSSRLTWLSVQANEDFQRLSSYLRHQTFRCNAAEVGGFEEELSKIATRTLTQGRRQVHATSGMSNKAAEVLLGYTKSG
jgi:hypothetical protein